MPDLSEVFPTQINKLEKLSGVSNKSAEFFNIFDEVCH